MSKIVAVSNLSELNAAAGSKGGKAVAYFWASWAPMCSQTDLLFERLSEQCVNIACCKIEAEAAEGGSKLDVLVGANAPEISSKILQFNGPMSRACGGGACNSGGCGSGGCGSGGSGSGGCGKNGGPSKVDIPAPEPETLNSKLEKVINREPVMLFMKGSPASAKCGFSRQIVDILQQQGVKFGSFDILEDEEVRQGLKTYSNWPTYPQLYSKGKLIGGLDVVKELVENGEFKSELGISESPLEARLAKLINSEPVMLFMKGSPNNERCGFSRQIVAILQEKGVKFGSFDILEDEDVRQGLKTYSNWPTYPQLYSKGKLIGGLDIVKELLEGGELLEALGM